MASTSAEPAVRAILEYAVGRERADRFDLLLAGDVVPKKKPDPAIYRLAVERLGVSAERCVFVDDVAAYLVPAREMGMTVVHQVDTRRTISQLSRLFDVAMAPAP